MSTRQYLPFYDTISRVPALLPAKEKFFKLFYESDYLTPREYIADYEKITCPPSSAPQVLSVDATGVVHFSGKGYSSFFRDFQKSGKATVYHCSSNCILDEQQKCIDRYVQILERISQCDIGDARQFYSDSINLCDNANLRCFKKRGHPPYCYPFECSSDLLYLRYIATHFSEKVTSVVESVVRLRTLANRLNALENAICSEELEYFSNLYEEKKANLMPVDCSDLEVPSVVDCVLESVYKVPLCKFNDEQEDTLPRYACVSCRQVFSKRGTQLLSRLIARTFEEKAPWINLVNNLKKLKLKDDILTRSNARICKCCL